MRRHRRLRSKVETLGICLAGMWAWASLPMAAQSHHFVYLSSAAAHTISGFEASQPSGSIAQVAGSPFSTGHDPTSLTFHPSGRFLYAVNSDESSVSAFAVHPVTGALTELPASPFAVGAGAMPRFIAVESSGKFLYVVGTLTDPQGASFTRIAYYSIDAAGALSPTPEDTTSPVPLSPVGMASTSNDHFVYIVGTTSSNNVAILTLELDPVAGTLSSAPFTTLSGQSARSLALSSGGQCLFVAYGQSQGVIDTYDLPPDGMFGQPRATFSIAGASAPPFAMAADQSGSYLYAAVANLGLIGFAIDSGGTLTALPGSPFAGPPVSPSAVAVADPVASFSNVYYEQRAFQASASGDLSDLIGSPLPVTGVITGIAAASPVDHLPTDPVNPISGPQISLSPSSLQFAAQRVGATSAPLSVSLQNPGDAPLLLSGISLTGDNKDDFTIAHDCVAAVNPNDSCTIAVTFQPVSEGQREASLSFVDNAPDSPHEVALSGTAQLPFSLQSGNSASSVTAGDVAQFDLQLVPAAAFTGAVSLACTGAPEQASCDVPASIDVTGTAPVAFSVRVPTKARSALMPTIRLHPSGRDQLVMLFAVAQMLWLFIRFGGKASAKREAKVRGAAALLLLCISLVLTSCSGTTGPSAQSSSPAAPAPAAGTPAGQYSLTVTATAGTVTEPIQLSLTVR